MRIDGDNHYVQLPVMLLPQYVVRDVITLRHGHTSVLGHFSLVIQNL